MKIKNQKSPTLSRADGKIKNAFLGLAAACILAAPSCSSGTKDFNDVIPQMMKPGPKPTDAAGDLFDPVSADKRREAIAYLNDKKWGHEAAYMAAYNLLATDPDPMVKAQAMRALGESGNPEVAAVLIKGLNDTSELVRQDAAVAANRIYSEKLIDPLVSHMIKDTDAQTRINCTEALPKYHVPKVMVGLAVALDDKDPAVAYWAWDGLAKITGQRSLPHDSKPWHDWIVQHYPEAAKIDVREEM